MDKYEYKVRAEEIESLIRQREYEQAAEIADTIDWRRVKSVKMLCTVSDLYKVNRRYEDARDMLLLAYEHRPGARNICYALCELYLKTGEIVQAVEYYKEFVQVAPRDAGRFILLYKIYEVQEVSLEERIAVLEELKKYDYREKWAYELAYLYHRVGLETRCVEECDEMILWFGEGSYVIKAMELKMLHQPLSAEQQEKYDHRFDEKPAVQSVPEQSEEQSVEGAAEALSSNGDTKVFEPVRSYETTASVELSPEESGHAAEPEELDIQVKTVDVGMYNTINLQAELAEGLKEVLGTDAITRSIVAPMMEDPEETGFFETMDDDVFDEEWIAEGEFAETAAGTVTEPAAEQTETVQTQAQLMEQTEERTEEAAEETIKETIEEQNEDAIEELFEEPVLEAAENEVMEIVPEKAEAVEEASLQDIDTDMPVEPPKEMAHVLSQESDGQISLVLPESGQIEKQITGQMSIEDIMAEWERLKKENQEKRREEVRQHVLQQTGNMFTEFEAAVRDGLLEQLENSEEDESDEVEELAEIAENTEEDGEDSEQAVEMIAVEKVLAGQNGIAAAGAVTKAVSEEAAATAEAQAESEETEAAATAEAQAESEETETAVAAEAQAEFEETETAVAAEAQAESEETETAVAAEVQAESEETETAVAAEAQTESETTEAATTTDAEPVAAAGDEDKAEEKAERKAAVRPLTEEETNLYAPYIQSENTKEQLVRAIDGISLAAYTGNVIITGEEGMDTVTLAKNMIHEAQSTDSNLSGKIAKISGYALNRKNVEETLKLLQNGALIIQKASEMEDKTVQDLYKALQKENLGIIIIIEDKRKSMNKFLETHEQLLSIFTERVDVEAMSNDELVAFGKQYAYDNEYSIDDLGVLALHTRIDELQTIDHAVTAPEVRTMVDDAIHHANRKTLRHFFDILFAKRYDEEDMIVLTERDFA